MSVVYVDTSALIKRVVDEAESESVFAAIGGSYRRGDVLVSSPLARLELWRSLRRRGISNPSVSVEEALEGLSEFPWMTRFCGRLRRSGVTICARSMRFTWPRR